VQKPKVQEPPKKLALEEINKPKTPEIKQEDPAKEPAQAPTSARQKKLDEIKEDVEEEDKEGTQENPLKYIKAKDLALELAESQATKELRVLIASLEATLSGKTPKPYFMPQRYRSDDGSTVPVTTMFKHANKDIERARAVYLRGKVNTNVNE
jgi:hypothetical protein